jgi:hypothetical protein
MEDEDQLDYIARNKKIKGRIYPSIFNAIEKGIYEASQIGKHITTI